MEFFSHPIPAAIVLLGVLVLVHEAGHFIVGRLCGIAVDVFSIGFGPPIVNFKFRGVHFRLSWIPLGGYVKFFGMIPNEELPEKLNGIEFNKATLPRRMATVAAGPIANLILAFVAYTTLGMNGIPHVQAIVGEMQNDSPALAAGIKFQDKILEISGKKIDDWFDMRDIIAKSPNKKLSVKVERKGKVLDFELVPDSVPGYNRMGKKLQVGRIGIVPSASPSIIAISDETSIAAKIGLVTGQKITAVRVENEWVDIKYWRSFVDQLQQAFGRGDQKMALRIAKSNKKDAETFEVDLPLPATAVENIDKTNLDAVAEIVGIDDAQLVVEEIRNEESKILLPGDKIVRWNDQPVLDIYTISELQRENKKPTAQITVVRNFETMTFDVPLKEYEMQMPSGKEVIYILSAYFLGASIEPEPRIEKYDNIFAGAWYGLKETAIQATFLSKTLGRLISGDVPLKALGGPMLIAKVAGDAAEAGWQAFLGTMALISVNLAVLNLFPIPVLDGGQLVICGLEAIRRKKLSEVAVENFQKIGFVMIMALVVLATYNDLSRFWTSMLRSVTRYFQ